MPQLTKRFSRLILLAAFCVTLGCSEKQEIESQRISKSQSGLDGLREKNRLTESSTASPTRMVVAIFEKPELMWFLKISGPVDHLKSTEPQWKEFLENIKFEDGKPVWDLPADWSDAGPKPMRHATFVIGDFQPPLEFVISNLSTGQDLLLNLNRWRRQINLPPASQNDLESQLVNVTSNAGDYLLFDQIGSGSGKMQPPFAGGNPHGSDGTVSSSDSTAPASDVTYSTPAGWTKGRASAMVPVRLVKSGNEKSGESPTQITIVKMPADINEWGPNVKRWAGQVAMGHLTNEQLSNRTSSFSVDGIEGKLIDLVDPESDSSLGAIAGMVKQGGSAWFIKLSGDKQTVDESKDVFHTFIESLRFK